MFKALITGGGGFVGGAIIENLQRDGVECIALGRNRYPHLEKKNITCVQCDITSEKETAKCIENVDVVFHVAALAGIWGDWNTYYNLNVIGTENVIRACKVNGIDSLVYTSTPSVIFDSENIINGDESLPYPKKFLCHYAHSKAMAEKLVLGTDQRRLKTCAIRPHLIWGPNDPHLIPRLLQRGREKNLRIIGKGQNMVDVTYITNVAYGHVLAAKNLLQSGTARGQAYFLGQEKSVNMWDWINTLFENTGVPKVDRRLPFEAAYFLGGALELFHLAFKKDIEPRMTRFMAEQMAKSHCFSHEKAQNDLGYKPLVSLDEGMDRLLHWLKNNG